MKKYQAPEPVWTCVHNIESLMTQKYTLRVDDPNDTPPKVSGYVVHFTL
jgi:hypothetical protein